MIEQLPIVTIITSTYKHERYLSKAIDSVLSQDYPRIEYIVINDGSPDGTEEILRSYGDKFYWETQANMGETPTLNRAINMAKGELIGKLSSDDYLYPGAIREMVNQFLLHSELIVVYADFDLVDENDILIQNIQKPDYNFIDPIRCHLCLPGPCALFKKQIFEELGGFDIDLKILFDMDFWWRAGLMGPFARIPKSLSAFRQHRNSQSSSGSERMALETVRFVEKFYSTPGLPQELLQIKNEAFSNAYYAAAMQFAQAKNDEKLKTYLKKSFTRYPLCYLKKENCGKMINIIDVMISPKLTSILKKLKSVLFRR